MRREYGSGTSSHDHPSDPWDPDVTVVLLAHKPGEHEIETAELVRRQAYGGRILLHVIDSSPDVDRSANLSLRRGADCWEAIPPASFGHGTTRNRALDACTTPIVAYLSQDAHPGDVGWLEALVRPLAGGEAEASYGRQMPPVPDAEREATFDFLYPESAEIKSKSSVPDLGIRTFHFSDVTSAYLTDVASAVRFPTDLPTFEDVGLAKRFLDRGYRIAYVPEARVLHAHSLSRREMVGRYRQIGAIYERLGIFSELREAGRGPLFLEGLRVTKAVSGSKGKWSAPSATPVLVGGLKAAAVAWGRWEARRAMIRERPRQSEDVAASSAQGL